MGSGMAGRLNNKLNEATTSYNNLKTSTGMSYKNSSISGLYESAQAQVQETKDEVERTTSSSSSGSGKTALTIALALSALTALTPVAATLISGKKGSSKAAAGTNVDANLAAFQTDTSKSSRKTLEKDLAALRTQRDAILQTVKTKENEIARLDAERKQDAADSSVTKSKQDEISAIDNELSGADKSKGYGKALADVEAKDAEIVAVDTQVKNIEGQNTETVEARDKAQTAKEKAESASAEYATKISAAEGELPGLKSNLSSIETQLKTAKKENGKKVTVTTEDGQSVQQKKDNSAQITELTQKVQTAKAKVEAKEREIKELKEGKDGKGGKKAQDDIVKAKTKEIENYNKSMTDGKTNVKDLLAKKETLTAEKQALQDTANTEKDKLINKKAELEAALAKGVDKSNAEKMQALQTEVDKIKNEQLKPLEDKIATVEKSLGIATATPTESADNDGKVDGNPKTQTQTQTQTVQLGKVGADGVPEYLRKPDNVDNDTSVESMIQWEKQDIPQQPENGEKRTVNGKEYVFENNVWKDKDGKEYKPNMWDGSPIV